MCVHIASHPFDRKFLTQAPLFSSGSRETKILSSESEASRRLLAGTAQRTLKAVLPTVPSRK
jgi:hypothetical protein